MYYREKTPTKEQLVQLIHKGGLVSPNPESRSQDINFKEQIEKENIMNALIQNNGNIPLTAKQLSMSKSTLYRKINKYKLN